MPGFEELTIRLPDGYKAHARWWQAEPSHGAALYLHGIQSHCGWYGESARRLVEAGISVLQPDRRGSGRNPADRGHAESAGQLVDDAFACLDLLTERSGCEKCHLIGVSWGGKLATVMHVTRPERTATLSLVTPGLFPVVGVSRTEMLRIGFSMASAPRRSFDIPLNDPALFTAMPERVAYLRSDALQIHQATAGFYLASRRLDKPASKLRNAVEVPLHLMLAGDERIIDNERTRAFVRELNWGGTLITTYGRSRHTLEFEPDREVFFADLAGWMGDPRSHVEHVGCESA